MRALFCSLAVAVAVAEADTSDRGHSAGVRHQAAAVSDAELEAARGGFVLDGGMVVNFSIDRRVYQNGVETFASYFESSQDIALLQNGSPGIGAQFSDGVLNAIIQNTMDNQLIETVSQINIELRNAAALEQGLSGAGIFTQFLEPVIR
jgi:hypothetical protein